MVELGPLGPVDPATGRHPNTPAAELLNYWAHGSGSEPLRKPAAQRTYTYVQTWRYPWDVPGLTEAREARYVVRVTEDRAGRRHVRTERYDPERGSGPNLKRVDLPDLPKSITIPMFVVFTMVTIIIALAPLPIMIPAVLAWALLGWTKVYKGVQRARMARLLRKGDDDLPALHADERPPLLSAEELDAITFKLANPDEDRTFDEPPPIPMARALRDPAWKRWADRLEELPGQEYRVGRMTYDIKQRNGFSSRTDHAVFELIYEIRRAAASCGDTVTVWNGSRSASKTVHREDDESLRPLFEALGREVLGPERVAQLDDRRRAAAHGEPMLDRRFAAKTDCADGHVGEHPILSTFIDSTGRKRVRRGCRWCPGSTWSELV